MNGLLILIPIALGMGLCALVAFFWALRSDQFEDLDGAALRIFMDDTHTDDADATGGRGAEDDSVSDSGAVHPL